MQTVIEVQHHRNVVLRRLTFDRRDQRLQRHVLKVDFGNIDDKGRSRGLRRGKQRAQEMAVEHVERTQRIAVLTRVR
ncbi:hypothetical protein D3C78_1786660 [compost metagenome]